MDEIKTFAMAAEMVYQAAVEQARQQHADKSQLAGAADEMADAKKSLTLAAQAVEGPAATADGYSALGAALPSAANASSSVMSVTA